MATLTTRPNATISQTGAALTGAATREAAVNDDSDTSYVTLDANGDKITYGFAEPTIPAGGLVKSIAARARTRKVGSQNGRVNVSLAPDGTSQTQLFWLSFYGLLDQPFPVTWTSILTAQILSSVWHNTDGDQVIWGSGPSDLQVALVWDHGEVRIVELYVDTVYVAKPVVVVDLPTGTLTEANAPTVSWTPTLDADGGAQNKYRVKVFTAAQYGAGGFDPSTSTAEYDSGEVTGADTSDDVSSVLADGNYRAYVRIAQEVNGADHWSDWDYEAFTVDVNRPAVPTLLADGQDDEARVRLRVHAETGDATSNYFQVQREDPTYGWVDVYNPFGSERWPASMLWTPSTPDQPARQGYDYEARNGVQETYRARAIHDYSGVFAYSDWTSDVTATWEQAEQWFLKAPAHPGDNLAVTLRSQPGRSRTARVGVHQPLGRKFPVTVSGSRQADQGEVIFRMASEDESLALDAFLDENPGPVLLQGPPEATRWHDRWITLGDLTAERAVDSQVHRFTFEGFTWSEVERPLSAAVTTDEGWQVIQFS